MQTFAPTLNSMTRCAHRMPQVAKSDVTPGDWVIIETVKSLYILKVLDGDLYEAWGGWFEKKGLAPVRIRISGVTWGGSAIMPKILAACGLRVEFQNRLITSPVKRIAVVPYALGN